MSRAETILFLALTLAAAAPFALLENPPLQDYPNTLARAVILSERDSPERPYREDFRVVRRPVPDQATDIAIPALARVVGFEAAGKAMIVLGVVLLPLGTLALFAALGQSGVRPWTAFWVLPFAHNWYVAMGLLNFVLGLGLSLLLLALRVRWSSRVTPVRLVALAAGTTILYFVHLFALGAFGLAVLAMSLAERRTWVRRGLDLTPFAPAAVLFAVYRVTEGLPHGLLMGYDGLYFEKARLFANVLVMFSWTEGVIVSVLLALGWGLLRRGGPAIPGRRAAALALAFGGLYAVFPKELLGVYYADERLLVYLAVAVLAAWPLPERRRRLAVATAAVVTVLALSLSTARLVRLDREIGEELTVLESMEPNRRVLPVDNRPFVARVDVWHHVACWYTVRRGGTTAYQFAKPGEHVLRWNRTLAAPREFFTREAGHPPPNWAGIVPDFDYLWKIGAGPPAAETMGSIGVRIVERPDAEVWKLVAGSEDEDG